MIGIHLPVTDMSLDESSQTEDLATTKKRRSRVLKTRSSLHPSLRMRLLQRSASLSARSPS
jgi:hypothetical protein